MTGSRDFKRLVRQRMAETGDSYTVARSHFDAPDKKPSAKKAVALDTVAAFKKHVYGRRRTTDLASHLERHYGVDVSLTTQLDVGVFRVDLHSEPSWIARVFPAVRALSAVRDDVDVLRFLEDNDVPAERLASHEPISMLGGQPVLVTSYVPGMNCRNKAGSDTMRYLGALIGRLAALPNAPQRSAGSWHHLSVNGGGRRSDIDVLLSLLRDASADEALVREIEAQDDLDDLPTGLIHPDPCGANLISLDDEGGILVDWSGAGRGPRIAALATLVGSSTVLSFVDSAVDGYRSFTVLEPRELDRLETALVVFPIILNCWSFLFQGAPLADVMIANERHYQRAGVIAERVREAFAAAPMGTDDEPAAPQASLF